MIPISYHSVANAHRDLPPSAAGKSPRFDPWAIAPVLLSYYPNRLVPGSDGVLALGFDFFAYPFLCLAGLDGLVVRTEVGVLALGFDGRRFCPSILGAACLSGRLYSRHNSGSVHHGHHESKESLSS
jgi:hypothetical protein